jgi:hypothetical protein
LPKIARIAKTSILALRVPAMQLVQKKTSWRRRALEAVGLGLRDPRLAGLEDCRRLMGRGVSAQPDLDD